MSSLKEMVLAGGCEGLEVLDLSSIKMKDQVGLK